PLKRAAPPNPPGLRFPKRNSKKSENPLSSNPPPPKPPVNGSCEEPPPLPALAPSNTSACFQSFPYWSYFFLFSGSLSTSLASLTCWNFTLADASLGFRSGWYFRASRRYASRISLSDASLPTPNIL